MKKPSQPKEPKLLKLNIRQTESETLHPGWVTATRILLKAQARREARLKAEAEGKEEEKQE